MDKILKKILKLLSQLSHEERQRIIATVQAFYPAQPDEQKTKDGG